MTVLIYVWETVVYVLPDLVYSSLRLIFLREAVGLGAINNNFIRLDLITNLNTDVYEVGQSF